MDESGTYEKMRFTGTDTQAPSGAEPDVSYVQMNVTATLAPRVRREEVGLSSTYAEVKFPNDEHVIDEDQAPPIAAGLRKLPTNAQPAAHEQHPKGKIGNRPDSLICLLCLVMSAFIVTVAGLSIHVSQIRQSKETSHRNYHQLNSSLQFKLSAVKSNLSDLRHQICELLNFQDFLSLPTQVINPYMDHDIRLLTLHREPEISRTLERGRQWTI
ncbi:uncharacterized protein LOC132386208 [Hypanus sabinus]|uniref:uncharacterized protein LOC132386208 n=1 Tax=Hypanus sabinus TaxID=79690 RepID=UPI0028C4623D|nr:uncharacterized protein LOC132386208 [Hypanus sabinus]